VSGLTPVTDISVTVAPIGVKFCTMLHISPGHKHSGGGISRKTPKFQILGLNFGHLTANVSKTVSRKIFQKVLGGAFLKHPEYSRQMFDVNTYHRQIIKTRKSTNIK